MNRIHKIMGIHLEINLWICSNSPSDFIGRFANQYLIKIIRTGALDLAGTYLVNVDVQEREAAILTHLFKFQNFFVNKVQYNIVYE